MVEIGTNERLETFVHTLQQSALCFLSLPQSRLLRDADVSVQMLRLPDLIQTLSAELGRGDPSLSERQSHLWTRTDGGTVVAVATGPFRRLSEILSHVSASVLLATPE